MCSLYRFWVYDFLYFAKPYWNVSGVPRRPERLPGKTEPEPESFCLGGWPRLAHNCMCQWLWGAGGLGRQTNIDHVLTILKVLSLPPLRPLSRLTYAAYLVHPLVILFNYQVVTSYLSIISFTITASTTITITITIIGWRKSKLITIVIIITMPSAKLLTFPLSPDQDSQISILGTRSSDARFSINIICPLCQPPWPLLCICSPLFTRIWGAIYQSSEDSGLLILMKYKY